MQIFKLGLEEFESNERGRRFDQENLQQLSYFHI